MVEVVYRDGRGTAQRIADRLKPSSVPGYQTEAREPPATPATRTNTCIYNGGTQGVHGDDR